jgi:hypothetical protein
MAIPCERGETRIWVDSEFSDSDVAELIEEPAEPRRQQDEP